MKIFNFVKTNLTQLLLVIVAVSLVVMSVSVTGTLSFDNADQVDSWLSIIREFVIWIVFAGLAGAVCYIAITGSKQADAGVATTLEQFQQTDAFTTLEVDYQNMPNEIKQAVPVAIALLQLMGGATGLKSIEALKKAIEDVADGPESGDTK